MRTIDQSGNTVALGLKIDASYSDGKSNPQKFRWVQTVRTTQPYNNSVNPNQPYNDPLVSDDPPGNFKPFYYTNLEIPHKVNNSSINFLDKPRRPLSNSDVVWSGELSAVQNVGGYYKPKITINYHFQIFGGDNSTTLGRITVNQPSDFQTQTIDSYNAQGPHK